MDRIERRAAAEQGFRRCAPNEPRDAPRNDLTFLNSVEHGRSMGDMPSLVAKHEAREASREARTRASERIAAQTIPATRPP
ncbi:hypothetical protein A7982_12343 [Minicystis rosea]|nr:hypothetical protein A7982_12343 [Minicystis rosea]